MGENIAGKAENAGYQYFLLLPLCFQKASFSRSSKMGLCGKGLMNMYASLTFPKKRILDSSKLKGFADKNFEFAENDKKFSIWIETLREKEKL